MTAGDTGYADIRRKISRFPIPFFDVSPDGKKILVSRLSQHLNQSVTLVTNFAEGLNKAK